MRNKLVTGFILALQLSNSGNLTGQGTTHPLPQNLGMFNGLIEQVRYSEELGTPNYVQFRDVSTGTLNISQAPLLLTTLYKLENQDQILHEKTIDYINNMRVARFLRYYHDIKVEHGAYTVLSHDDQIRWINAEHYPLEGVNIIPSMNEEVALTRTLDQLDSDLYAWEATDQLLATRTDLHPQMRGALEKVRLQEYPTGELVIVRDFSAQGIVVDLAYKFVIESVEPLFRDHVYVNAHDGHIMLRDPQIKHGTGDTRYAGNRSFPTTEVAPNIYELKGIDPVSGVYCDTRSLEGLGGLPLSIAALYTLATPIQDGDETSDPCLLENPPVGETGDDSWDEEEHHKSVFGSLCCPTYVPGSSCNEFNNDDVALDAQWGATMVARYWLAKHNRNSYDGIGADIFSFVHYGDAYDNAFWNGSYMTYGDGSYQGGTNPDGTFAPLSSLDVCAHEIGHAICETTSNLLYQRESGAMNEGFSDIWAAAIERYVLDSIDGTLPLDPFGIGEQIDESDGGLPPGDPGSRCLRWMDDPKAESNPDTYGGTNWQDPNCIDPNLATDYCGVHGNSGVLNKWYYLLTVGSGQPLSLGLNKVSMDDEVNDQGETYNVTGLGSTKSDLIAFGGEMLLTPTATFAEMREASIQVSRVLFGICSSEEIQTTNAWHAVGVGDTFAPCLSTIAFNALNPVVIPETGVGFGCDASSEVTLGMFSFMATQTIQLVTTGNAIPGIDFDLDTTSLTFNGNETKFFTITIYDDKVVENTPDTIIISFNDGGFSDADTLIIIDDDVIPSIGGTQNLLTESFEGVGMPAGWNQVLVNPESANHWEFNGSGTEAGRAYAALPASPTAVYDQTADANVRMVTPLIDARGKQNVTITFDWEAGGETEAGDETILYDYGTFQVSMDGSIWTDIEDFFGLAFGHVRRSGAYAQPHPELDNQTFYLGFRWYNDALLGTSFSFAVDNVAVTGDGLSIATEVGSTMQADIPANTQIAFISTSDNKILANIDNAAVDLGCTEVSITEAVAESDLIAASTCDFRSAKVFEVTSLITSDSFDLILYFQESEVDAWVNPALLNILCVKHSDIDDEASGFRIIPNAQMSIDDHLADPAGYISYTFRTTAEYLTYTLTDRLDVPAVRIVMNTNDAGDNSLRERIDAACPADTIRFDGSLTGDTIRLSGPEIALNKDLVIVGPGMHALSISGEQNGRVLNIDAGASVHMYDLELREGSALTDGGAVLNSGTLHLVRVRLRKNFENGIPAGMTNHGLLRFLDEVVIDLQ